jgi:hypothetical protein
MVGGAGLFRQVTPIKLELFYPGGSHYTGVWRCPQPEGLQVAQTPLSRGLIFRFSHQRLAIASAHTAPGGVLICFVVLDALGAVHTQEAALAEITEIWARWSMVLGVIALVWEHGERLCFDL